MPTTLTDRLFALAREAAASSAAQAGPVVLADRPDGTVVACGDVVAKAHPPVPQPEIEAYADQLTVRLRIAAHSRLAGILLPPLSSGGVPSVSPRPEPLPDGRLASLWPRGTPVAPDAPEAAPWEAAGLLLGRLHSVPPDAIADASASSLPGALPPMRGPVKAARALARMREALGTGDTLGLEIAEAADAVEHAWSTLPAWCRAEERPPPSHTGTLCHGDFHLGQLVRHPAPDGPWQLIDVDDLGHGDPAWDLARPAAWYAVGLLPAASWETFLAAYQTQTGTSGIDPWPRLDAPARALTVQTAALAVAKAHTARRPLDDAEEACTQACARIAGSIAPRDRTTSTAGPADLEAAQRDAQCRRGPESRPDRA